VFVDFPGGLDRKPARGAPRALVTPSLLERHFLNAVCICCRANLEGFFTHGSTVGSTAFE